MALHFSKTNQSDLLNQALDLTGAKGWRKDAIAFGAYGDAGADDLRCIVVFQNIDNSGGEMHFGMVPGHRIGPEVVRSISTLALHPRALNLRSVWARICEDNIEAQIAALKCGFRFEYRTRSGLAGEKDVIVFSMRRGDTPLVTATPQPPMNETIED